MAGVTLYWVLEVQSALTFLLSHQPQLQLGERAANYPAKSVYLAELLPVVNKYNPMGYNVK